MAQRKSRTKTDENPGVVKRLLLGQVVSSDFFARHWLIVFSIVTLIMVFITNKYNCQTKMEEIQRLKTELEIVRTERVRVRSAYMSRIRESSMQKLVDSLGLNLRVQQRPPYQLERK